MTDPNDPFTLDADGESADRQPDNGGRPDNGQLNPPLINLNHPAYPEANPYQAPSDLVSAEASATQTDLPRPLSRPEWWKQRIWTSILAIPVAWIVFMVFSVLMMVVAVFAVVEDASLNSFRSMESLQSVSKSRIGLFLLMVPPQIMMASVAIAAAYFSPVGFRKRLGLVRGQWPIWAWVGGALATPLIGIISGVVASQFLPESPQLKEMSKIFGEHAASGFLIPLGIMVGLTPAICEEVLFRGYVQTRLTKVLHPMIGIGIASLAFAAFHMDFVHVISVFPLGVYMGFLCWKSRSLFPAVLAHFVNNFVSVMMVSIAPEDELSQISGFAVVVVLGLLVSGILGLASVAIAAILYNHDDVEAIPG